MASRNVLDIVRKSVAAQCGMTEREVNVPASQVSSTIQKLKRAGYYVVGTSHGKTKVKKIWFAKSVSL